MSVSTRLKVFAVAMAGGAALTAGILGLANAQDTKATGVAAQSATLQPVNRAAINPVLLRRPEAPAEVDWAAASQTMARSPAMSAATTVNPALRTAPQGQTQIQPLAARLPRDQINKTRLPMLMPRTGSKLRTDKAKMVSFGSAYSLNLPQDKGMQITLMGNRSQIRADRGSLSKKKARAKVAGMMEPVRIIRLEDGWTASFKRYGVLYTVDLLCDDINSAECATDTYLRTAISDMNAVTMGDEARKEAAAAGVKQ